MTNFTAQAVMEAGYQRIKSIADRHGINSPEVLAACERWGGILDDVNYPDSTCRWCGDPVTYVSEAQAYYHKRSNSKHCRTVAAAVATPWKLGDSEPVERTSKDPGNIPMKQRPPRNVIKK